VFTFKLNFQFRLNITLWLNYQIIRQSRSAFWERREILFVWQKT